MKNIKYKYISNIPMITSMVFENDKTILRINISLLETTQIDYNLIDDKDGASDVVKFKPKENQFDYLIDSFVIDTMKCSDKELENIDERDILLVNRNKRNESINYSHNFDVYLITKNGDEYKLIVDCESDKFYISGYDNYYCEISKSLK